MGTLSFRVDETQTSVKKSSTGCTNIAKNEALDHKARLIVFDQMLSVGGGKNKHLDTGNIYKY